MPFSDFVGNTHVVDGLRELLGRRRFPHAVILAGPAGAGKYTLSLMLAKAMNCLRSPLTRQLPDFCGECSNCSRIAMSEDLAARCAEALEARENLREADKKETRLFVQSHPDVLVIPPDPPQMMIKMDQVRRVIRTIHFRPGEGRERVYIFSHAAFMREAANSLLKVLEEPPDFASIFLLTENPGELLPTIRSRSMIVNLSALPNQQIEVYLGERRPNWNLKQRSLVARLSGGAVGRAAAFDLSAYVTARAHALALLRAGLPTLDHGELFKITDGYRAGVDGRDKMENLLRTLYSLLEDLTFLSAKAVELVRNVDIQPELHELAQSIDFDWIAHAADRLAEVERGMRRNLLRSLSLDAFSASLERTRVSLLET
jgi:DNA polymerase-3 subunit delta'